MESVWVVAQGTIREGGYVVAVAATAEAGKHQAEQDHAEGLYNDKALTPWRYRDAVASSGAEWNADVTDSSQYYTVTEWPVR